MAHEMRIIDLERRQDEREERRFVKESKRMERTQKKEDLKQSKKLALEKERSRFGAARPYMGRSHSVGAPATIRVAPVASSVQAPLTTSTTTYTSTTPAAAAAQPVNM